VRHVALRALLVALEAVVAVVLVVVVVAVVVVGHRGRSVLRCSLHGCVVIKRQPLQIVARWHRSLLCAEAKGVGEKATKGAQNGWCTKLNVKTVNGARDQRGRGTTDPFCLFDEHVLEGMAALM